MQAKFNDKDEAQQYLRDPDPQNDPSRGLPGYEAMVSFRQEVNAYIVAHLGQVKLLAGSQFDRKVSGQPSHRTFEKLTCYGFGRCTVADAPTEVLQARRDNIVMAAAARQVRGAVPDSSYVAAVRAIDAALFDRKLDEAEARMQADQEADRALWEQEFQQDDRGLRLENDKQHDGEWKGTAMLKELLKREDDRGTYRVLYLSGGRVDGVYQPAGLYVDVARTDGSGYRQQAVSYREAANTVFSEYGQFPEYADGYGKGQQDDDAPAGLRKRSRSRHTGTMVGLYEADAAGFDPAGGPWVTVCEDHGTICNHQTLKAARQHVPWVDWCEDCQRDDDDLPDEQIWSPCGGSFTLRCGMLAAVLGCLAALLMALAAPDAALARDWGDWKTFQGQTVQVARTQTGAICHVKKQGTFQLADSRATAKDCARASHRASKAQPRPDKAQPKASPRPKTSPSGIHAARTEAACDRAGGVWVKPHTREGYDVRGYCRSYPSRTVSRSLGYDSIRGNRLVIDASRTRYAGHLRAAAATINALPGGPRVVFSQRNPTLTALDVRCGDFAGQYNTEDYNRDMLLFSVCEMRRMSTAEQAGTALHEVWHGLGFDHKRDRNSIMHPNTDGIEHLGPTDRKDWTRKFGSGKDKAPKAQPKQTAGTNPYPKPIPPSAYQQQQTTITILVRQFSGQGSLIKINW